MIKKFHFLYLILFSAASAAAAQSVWHRPVQPPAAGGWSAMAVHPLRTDALLVASRNEIFEGLREGSWQLLWQIPRRTSRILKLLTFPAVPDTVFILTDNGVFSGNLKTRQWEFAFRGRSQSEGDTLSFWVSPEDPDHWLAGTESGLFETDDGGISWFPVPGLARERIPLLYFADGRLFVGAGERILVSTDFARFDQTFALRESGDPTVDAEAEDAPSQEADEEGGKARLSFIAGRAARDRLWLGTSEGVFESIDGGDSWSRLPQSGLQNPQIRDMEYSEVSGRLYAATPRGIYAFDFRKGRWEALYQGLEETDATDLMLIEGKDPALLALTGSGLVRFVISPEEVPLPQTWELRPDRALLFQTLLRLEPSVREVHRAVIRYNDLGNGKIKRWHAASRLRSLLPDFSFGRDLTRSATIDLDRGGALDPDRYILGPEDTSRRWDMDVTWNLGDLLWSSSQTSIDSRSKIMVEYRNDLVAEATRIYYERRRLQMEIAFAPAPSEREHFDKLLRMDELTSLLDGMTGGEMSERLIEIYREHPEMEQLWRYADFLESSEAVHTRR